MEFKTKLTIIVVIVFILAAGGVAYTFLKEYYEPSTETMGLSEYYSVPEGEAMMVMDGEIYEKNALWRDGHPYFDMETVVTLFNHRFYWDSSEEVLTLTTPTEIIRLVPDEREVEVNGEASEMDYCPVLLIDDGVYIAVEYTAGYADFTYSIYNDPDRVLLQHQWGDYLYADVVEATQVRSGNDRKKEVLAELAIGDCLMFIDGGGIQENGYMKVMTEDGVRGYVQSDALSDSYYVTTKSSYTAPEYTSIQANEPIYMGWQLLYTADNLSYIKEAAASADCLNVISPTWFFLSSTEGDFIDYANNDYVSTAHENGISVWATFKNDFIEGKFDGEGDLLTLLKSTQNRSKLTKNIMKLVKEYGLDGVNIDFEFYTVDTGVHFIQFLRELSVKCRNKGIVLSVDNFVPEPNMAYYDMAEQGELVDFVVIMGYDEHHSKSEEAGSVSSIDFIKKAIKDTTAIMPSSKIIMAVPFYTRLWKEKTADGVTTVTLEKNLSMREGLDVLPAHGVEAEWDEKTMQYYGEYEKNGALYRIWLEEEDSIAAKVSAIRDGGLAGVAAWKLGDEKSGMWEHIKETFEN